MKLIVKAPGSSSLEDVLQIICRSEEFSCKCFWVLLDGSATLLYGTNINKTCEKNKGIQLRRNEKKLLNDINSDKECRLRFHVTGENGKRKKRIQTREEKIFVLANDCLTGDPSVHDLSLNQVSILIIQEIFMCYFSLYSQFINTLCRTWIQYAQTGVGLPNAWKSVLSTERAIREL